ncbi:alcohol dehydrogenase catalytic domain-containing protein [Myxococcus faecalis]|uniref:alcohol dehydrogenase catalytic domain-containing protein n=1 Tax=Myxococcus faecalis TaxID=3115646 RepID=UPI003CFAF717
MRAIRYHEIGGPDVLRLEEVSDPTAGPGQVRIRVRAAGVNFADTERRRGLYDATAPLPRILGSEAAGGRGPGRRGCRLTMGRQASGGPRAAELCGVGDDFGG